MKPKVVYSDISCLQTFLLIFKFANHWNKRTFVLTANHLWLGTLMAIDDVTETSLYQLGFSLKVFRKLQKSFLEYGYVRNVCIPFKKHSEKGMMQCSLELHVTEICSCPY